MLPTLFAKGNHKTIQKLLRLRKEAFHDKAIRVSMRIQSIIMSIEKYSPSQIANHLKVNRTTVPPWINNWNRYKEEGLLEGHRSGRKSELSEKNLSKLYDIVESGPVSYGLNTGVWTSDLITEIIDNEFNVTYHPGHVRKLLKQIGFSVQRPTTKLINGDPVQKNKWKRYTYPNLKKKAKSEGAKIVYTDEVHFRQTPTLYRTWAPISSQPQIPTKGVRNTQKIFGAIKLVDGNFIYQHQGEEYFNYENYIQFLDKYLLIKLYQKGHRIY
ncbi:MAG: IS630 family transposase, partial [bacterium]